MKLHFIQSGTKMDPLLYLCVCVCVCVNKGSEVEIRRDFEVVGALHLRLCANYSLNQLFIIVVDLTIVCRFSLRFRS